MSCSTWPRGSSRRPRPGPALAAFAAGMVVLLGGLVLACAGAGLAAANWPAVAAVVVLPAAAVLWRIHAEENALLAILGDRYRAYAGQHRRLIPLIW